MSDTIDQVRSARPDHVPQELYWDHDLPTFASQFTDPFKGIGVLRKGPEIIYGRAIAQGRAGWIPTRYDVIQEIFLDPVRFSSKENIGVGPMLGVNWRLCPLEYDPPEHMLYRQVLQPHFQPSAVNGYETLIRGVARELIAKFEHKKGINFIDEFASLFPSYIFLDLMGLPREMLPQFFVWEHQFTRSTDDNVRVAGARAILNFMTEEVEKRKTAPRDDLMTAIVKARVKDRPLTHDEIMGMVMVLYFGGLDTVLSSLGWYFRHLALHPDLQQRLRDNPSLIPGAADDLLRAYGVVGTRRTVTEDLVLRGVTMKKGDTVLMPGFLACRDEAQYTDPDTVDPERTARHLTLATGPHNCLGTHLARREIKIVLEEWLARFNNIRIPEGSKQSWVSVGVWAMTELHLEWD